MDSEQMQDLLNNIEGELFSKFLLDSKYLLDNIKHTLKGEELTIEEQEYEGRVIKVATWQVPKDDDGKPRKPPINLKGYHVTLQKLQPLLDKLASSGNITKEEANQQTRINMMGLSEVYIINYDAFEFNSLSEMDSLLDTMLTLIIMQFSKSVNMELIKQLLTRHNITESNEFKGNHEPNITA